MYMRVKNYQVVYVQSKKISAYQSKCSWSALSHDSICRLIVIINTIPIKARQSTLIL